MLAGERQGGVAVLPGHRGTSAVATGADPQGDHVPARHRRQGLPRLYRGLWRVRLRGAQRLLHIRLLREHSGIEITSNLEAYGRVLIRSVHKPLTLWMFNPTNLNFVWLRLPSGSSFASTLVRKDSHTEWFYLEGINIVLYTVLIQQGHLSWIYEVDETLARRRSSTAHGPRISNWKIPTPFFLTSWIKSELSWPQTKKSLWSIKITCLQYCTMLYS